MTGDGPLEEELRKQVAQLGLVSVIGFVGRIPSEKLMQMYKNGEVNAVVLPSIVTLRGEKEGIPVALMEAMSYRIPVISTNTGGIPELLGGGAGLMVPPASAEALAQAIVSVMNDTNLQVRLAEKGYQRVENEFNLIKNASQLLKLIEQSSRGCKV